MRKLLAFGSYSKINSLQPHSNQSTNYRKEIDGLRALAVLPVILFHAGFQTFSGGFIGVDVFFVISGYLITTIILTELEMGKFSVLNFYERRARRILPALFFIMIITLPFAWLWLVPQEMISFSQSLIAVPLFISNVLFWKTSGYFESAAELKPLLHTWSLAVEEQYYLLFPIFLMLTWQLGKRQILKILFIVFIASLAIAQYFSLIKPAAAFYLLPTRGWEILFGAFIAFIFSRQNINIMDPYKPKFLTETCGILGIILILYAIFAFDNDTPYPSLYTLFPIIGTVLIILYATQNTFTGRILGNKIFVGIGLISYSAYLWHQPLFAFAKHMSLDVPQQAMLGLLSILSIILAYFSWRYVESPFRNKLYFGRTQIFLFTMIGSIFFIILGLAGYLTKGFEARLGEERSKFLEYFGSDTLYFANATQYFENAKPKWKYSEKINIYEAYRHKCNFYNLTEYSRGKRTLVPIDHISSECYIRNNKFKHSIFLWGDSHAQQLYSGLKHVMPDDWQILQVTTSGCVPKLKASPNKKNYCEYSNWFAYKTIIETKPDVVVIGQNLNHNVRNMELLGTDLNSIGVKKVIFTGPSPHWVTELPSIVVNLWDNVPRKTRAGLNTRVMNLNKNLKKHFDLSDNIRFVSIIDNFCDDSGCLVYIGDSLKTGITTWDYGHLTPLASLDFAKNVLVDEILRNR